MFYVVIGFMPLAFTGKIIYPFLLTPAADIEKFNYVSHIVDCIQPCILLYVLYASIIHLSRINIDQRVNTWVKKSTQDVGRLVIAILIYQVKELFDYLTYENTIPECFNQTWFLFLWELLPVAVLLFWALMPISKRKKDGTTR